MSNSTVEQNKKSEVLHNLAIHFQFEKQDIHNAISYYKKAADAGYDSSQANLGAIYLGFFGEEYANHSEGMRYLEMAAAQNNRTATQNLFRYYNGDFNKKLGDVANPIKAREYQEKLLALPGDDASHDVTREPTRSPAVPTSSNTMPIPSKSK